MRTVILAAVAWTCGLMSATAEDPGGPSEASVFDAVVKRKEAAVDAVFNELAAGLPKEGGRAVSARLELEHWRREWDLFHPPVRKPLKTKDGTAAEVVLLTAPALSMPGEDFSMAFLLVDNRIVDWASCWTYNRTATQELLLEDVDGDGFSDVAFRASAGWFGLTDKRRHGRPADERKWLYAYAVTARGFQSLFPNLDRDLKVKLSYDTGNQPIVLRVTGLPESLREQQMVECTISLTNTSDMELAIKPYGWFRVDMGVAGSFMTYGPADNRTVVRAGETVSQVIRLLVDVDGQENEVAMRWKFESNR